eukprot:scaffold15386_cov57-Phaeocystis_antarctica.AAC.5
MLLPLSPPKWNEACGRLQPSTEARTEGARMLAISGGKAAMLSDVAPLTSEEARQQAQTEGLTLRVADTKAGYFGVNHQPGRPKPYLAGVWRGGKQVSLGRFATAEEAALCVARSPEGREAAERAAAARPPSPALTSEEARQQARAEGLTLRVAECKTGYFGVYYNSSKPKPFQAKVRRGGKQVSLGCFATAEEAALCFARSPEGREVAERAAAAPPPSPSLTSEEARQQAQAEGLTLRMADSTTGYFGVNHQLDRTKPYQARVMRGGKKVFLGCFATAEEAALCVARSPEGREAAERAEAARPPSPAPALMGEEVRQQAQAEGLTLLVAENKTGYFGVRQHPGRPKPHEARVKRGGKQVHLGSFVTAEEAALCVARSPEGQAAASKAAAAPVPLMGDDDGGDNTGEESEEETVEVLDAVEVLVASDDEEEEALRVTMEAEEVMLVVKRKRLP